MKKIIGMFFTLLLLFQLGACGQSTLTWFPDGGIQFYAQSGTWVHGLSVGQAEIIDSVTSKHSQEDFWGWQISCTYDNQEVMDTADVTQICVIDGEEHEFDFHVAHGKLISSEWNLNRITCQLHDNCRIGVNVDDVNSVFFANPWTWGGEMPMDLNFFGVFSWGT